MLALIFDTETTGLLPGYYFKTNDKTCDDYMRDFPHIVQLSFMLFDCETLKMVESYDFIIKVSDEVDIPETSFNIHGIDKKRSNEEGTDLKECLNTLSNVYKKADIVVAHNLEFDLPLIQIEGLRHNCGVIMNKNDKGKQYYCNMKNTIELCNIIRTNSRGSYKKYPSQEELHFKLFETTPKNLHNSFNDILVCLRSYIKLIQDKDVCEHNTEINTLYSKLLEV